MESDCNVMEFYNCLHRLLTVMCNQWFTIRWITDHWQQAANLSPTVTVCPVTDTGQFSVDRLWICEIFGHEKAVFKKIPWY